VIVKMCLKFYINPQVIRITSIYKMTHQISWGRGWSKNR